MGEHVHLIIKHFYWIFRWHALLRRLCDIQPCGEGLGVREGARGENGGPALQSKILHPLERRSAWRLSLWSLCPHDCYTVWDVWFSTDIISMKITETLYQFKICLDNGVYGLFFQVSKNTGNLVFRFLKKCCGRFSAQICPLFVTR